MNADQLLLIDKPEKLFFSDEEATKKKFRDLAKEWHPDVCKDPRAGEVFDHINKLHAFAIEKIQGGYWGSKGIFAFQSDKKKVGIIYDRKCTFEFGDYFVCRDKICWLFESRHKEYWLAACGNMNFKYASDRMQKDMKRCLPFGIGATVTDTGNFWFQVDKPKELIRLKDIFHHLDGQIDARHVAWIMSRLHNICAYLSFAQISHQNISTETVYIEPFGHGAALLGGWEFAKTFTSPVHVLPLRTFNLLPWPVKTRKIALPHTDLDLIRAIGREIDFKCPAPMKEWFSDASTGNAFDEFKEWGKVLDRSFGPKRVFVPFELTAEQVYGG